MNTSQSQNSKLTTKRTSPKRSKPAPETNEDACQGLSAVLPAVVTPPDGCDDALHLTKEIANLTILGTPKAQPRARHVNGVTVSNTDPAVQAWQTDVAMQCCYAKDAYSTNELNDLTGKNKPLLLEVTFFIGTNKKERWGTPHTHKPDNDNLVKLVMDQMVKVGLIRGDDCSIAKTIIKKAWCRPDGSGARVRLSTYGNVSFPQEGVLNQTNPADKPAWL